LNLDSSDAFEVINSFGESEGPPKKPPKILTILGLLSVFLGIVIGIYGLNVTLTRATNSTQYLIGGLGYLLTALIPIILLQVVRSTHKSALRNNKEVPYDIYAGDQQLSRFLKIVALGLISALLPIIILFYPLAETFAG
jgi:hypothetical protein